MVKKAGYNIPLNILDNEHLWSLHMQKANLDKYVQLKLQQELAKEERIRNLLKQAIKSGDIKNAIERSLETVAEPKETPAMALYRKEADRLGIETEQRFGVRNIGIAKLDQPLRNIDGLLEILHKAKEASSKKEQKKLLNQAIKTTAMKTDYGRVHW